MRCSVTPHPSRVTPVLLLLLSVMDLTSPHLLLRLALLAAVASKDLTFKLKDTTDCPAQDKLKMKTSPRQKSLPAKFDRVNIPGKLELDGSYLHLTSSVCSVVSLQSHVSVSLLRVWG